MTFPGTAAVSDGARVVVIGASVAYHLAHLGIPPALACPRMDARPLDRPSETAH